MLLFLVWLDRAFHFLANQYKCTNSPATSSLLSLICRYWDIIFFVFSANASMSTIKSVANTLLEQHLAFLKLMYVVATLSSNSFLSLHQCRYQIGPWSTLIFYQNALIGYHHTETISQFLKTKTFQHYIRLPPSTEDLHKSEKGLTTSFITNSQ